MSERKQAGKNGRRLKDLESKKPSRTQQDVVRGGITDGTSNTLMLGEKMLPAVQGSQLRQT